MHISWHILMRGGMKKNVLSQTFIAITIFRKAIFKSFYHRICYNLLTWRFHFEFIGRKKQTHTLDWICPSIRGLKKEKSSLNNVLKVSVEFHTDYLKVICDNIANYLCIFLLKKCIPVYFPLFFCYIWRR